jgi:uncharacterized membrane protein (DUF485 family)
MGIRLPRRDKDGLLFRQKMAELNAGRISAVLHEPSLPVGKDPASPYKTRLGVWMFISYCLFYAGFVAINLLSPKAMAAIVFLGLNLATVYGFALIAVALILALIYNMLCTRKEAELADSSDAPSTKAGG